jgi:hypothetical protein
MKKERNLTDGAGWRGRGSTSTHRKKKLDKIRETLILDMKQYGKGRGKEKSEIRLGLLQWAEGQQVSSVEIEYHPPPSLYIRMIHHTWEGRGRMWGRKEEVL